MIESLKTKINFTIVSLILMLGVCVMAVSATTQAQDIRGSTNCGSNISLGTGCAKPDQASNRLEELIRTIINVFSAIVGSIAVIMIIIGGFRYITSAGDSNNVSGAKNTILYAIVGLVIVVFAQIIVRFVLQRT